MRASCNLTDTVAPDIVVLHLDLLVRYSSRVGRSSGQPHAGSDVASMEELAKQIPRQRPHHPSRLYRSPAMVLRLCSARLAVPTGEAAKAIHLFVGSIWRYPHWSARLGSFECWRRGAVVQDSEYRRGHVVLHDVRYHVHTIVMGCWYYRTV